MTERKKMKSFISLLSIIPMCAIICTANNDPYKLTAVNGSIIAEALYARVRRESTHIDEQLNMDPDIKNRICHYIFNSVLFMPSEKPAYIHQAYKQLLFKDPTLFLELYEVSRGSDLIFTNRTKPMNVYIGKEDTEATQDHAFVCFSMSTDDDEEDDSNDEKKLFIYFVSREYNLSDNPSRSHIAGRFIFYYNDNDARDRIELFGIAEEPAKSLSSPGAHVEFSYLLNRGGKVPAEQEEDDPVCVLKRDERLRVCAMVLNSTYFEGELKFEPEDKYVDATACVKRPITFQDEEVRSKVGEEQYEEWMIRCVPEQRYASYQAEYFISRVYHFDDQVFLYRWKKGAKSIVIENRFGDVRFQIERDD